MLKSIATAAAVFVASQGTATAADNAYRAKAVAYMLGNGDGLLMSKAKISVKLVDSNGDGIPEALVMDSNPSSCGSGGCAANILDLTGSKARSMADLLGFDLKVLPTKTGAWRDVLLVSRHTTKMVFRDGQYVFVH